MAEDRKNGSDGGQVHPLPTRRNPRLPRSARTATIAYMPPRGRRPRISDSLPPKRPVGGTPEQWAEAWRPAVMAAATAASSLMLAATFAMWA